MVALNGLTQIQREILLAVFKDCREFYSSRGNFDADFKRLSNATLTELYVDWKGVNRQLVDGETPTSSVLTHWDLDTFRVRDGFRAVAAMRQVLGLYTRLEGNADPIPAILAYKARVSSTRSRCPTSFASVARSLISAWLGPAPNLVDLLPKHGPGAVAEGLKMAEKPLCDVYFRQLDAVGGSALFHLNANHMAYDPRPLRSFRHGITRVIAVPKDFMKPRIISAEPTNLQFLQQGLARFIMARCEGYCPYINFRDQSVNANLSKRYESVATLDMSDASDLVSRRLVRQLFPDDWCRLLFALRSHFAKTPDGDIIPLRSFAPMGSALCFPVESVVFAAITVAVLLQVDEGKWFVGEKRKLCRIYGDDIIVPIDAARAVMSVLLETGFCPNQSKCCYKGVFRESCGAEWFAGHDVTVVRPRTLNPLDVTPQRGVMAGMPLVEHANRLVQLGFISAAQVLANLCRFPVALGNGAAYATPLLTWPVPGQVRWRRSLQRCEQLSTVVESTTLPSSLGDCYAYLFMGLACGWQSTRVLNPRPKPKTKWVLAAPLSER